MVEMSISIAPKLEISHDNSVELAIREARRLISL